MGQRPLTALGRQMLASLPPVLRDSHDYQAVLHCYAREVERFEGVVEQVRAQFNPATADVLLPAWEFELRLPVGGAGATPDERRRRVLARLKKLADQSEGREWEQRMTDLLGSGWSYQEHITGDATTPPANTIKVFLPFPAGNPRYIEAQTQVREITEARLDLIFETTEAFQLDADQMDVTAFGV